MDLCYPDAGLQGTPGGFHEIPDHLPDPIVIEGQWDGELFGIRYRTGRHGLPTPFGNSKKAVPVPGGGTVCLAPGMCQLNAGDCIIPEDERGYFLKERNMVILPDPEVVNGNTAFRGDGSRLGH